MAKPNWLEELAENWFRIRKYITQLHVRVPVFGRLELDLLAFNDEELLLVDLQTYIGERGTVNNEAGRVIKSFRIYDRLLKTPPYESLARGRKIQRLFIAGGTANAYREFKSCTKNSGIVFMPIEDFISAVVHEIRPYVAAQRWPFPSDDISRLMYQLIAFDFIK